jgi:hypothetical protein
MTVVNIKAFRGQIPRVSDRLLQPNQAVRALNCKITSGRLDPLAGLGQVYDANLSIGTVYRYRAFINGGYLDNWLTWPEVVSVALSPNANDVYGRFFFASESFSPRMSTYALAIQSVPYPTAFLALGIRPPVAAPSNPTVAGGSGSTETRSYAVTFVDNFGQESPPSPPSDSVTGYADGTWTIATLPAKPANSYSVSTAATTSPGIVTVTITATGFTFEQYEQITISGVVGMTSLNGTFRIVSVEPAANKLSVALTTAQTYTSGGTVARVATYDTANYKYRVYRTVGTSGDFLFVGETDTSATSFADSVVAADLGEILPTADSSTPPKNLVSLVSLPNGCLAGLAGNELCFSDPYMPYSWPIRNRYAFSGVGVAAVAASNSVIVLTQTFPILFTGSDPEAMSATTLETYAPCVSARGVVDLGGEVIYPSFDGLWAVSPGAVNRVTSKLYREEEWSQLNPASFTAAFHDGQYFATYTTGTNSRTLVLDLGEPDSVVEVEESLDALYRNEYDGKLYVAKGEILYEWDVNAGRAYESDWLSSTMQLPAPVNMSVAQVHADFGSAVPVDTSQITANEALIALGADAVAGHLNGAELLSLEINGSNIVPVELNTAKRVQFTLYSNNTPVFTKNVTSSKPFRLPSGYLSEVYNVGLNASVKTYSVAVATSVTELAQAS